jgi:site-specific recombinase XerD
MNAIVNRTEPNITILQIPKETESLIKVSVSENTLKPYQRALHNLETWLSGQTLSDVLLAEYITNLHKAGKPPRRSGKPLSQSSGNSNINCKESLTSWSHTQHWQVSRREGTDRGRGQVDGLTWQDVERVWLLAEMENTLAGLRDAAMIHLMSDCLLWVSEVVAVNVDDLKEKTLTLWSSDAKITECLLESGIDS